MTDLLLTIGSYPTPNEVARVEPYAVQMMETWRKHMGPHERDGRGDFEDFWEMAARLDAGISQATGEIWLEGVDREKAVNVKTGVKTDLDPLYQAIHEGRMLHYGPISMMNPMLHLGDTRADRYFDTRAFNDYAGRTVQLCGFGGGLEMVDAMTAAAKTGQSEVIIKATESKHGLWRVPVSTDRDANYDTVMTTLEWAPIRSEGQPGAFSVQEVIDMTYECRFFIVNSVPVTAAGCVEEHTPLDSNGPFSALMRAYRPTTVIDNFPIAPSPDPVENRPDLMERYVPFVNEVAALAEDEGSMPRAYVIDVAMNGDTPVVIEMNSLSNSGLYATEPRRVVAAMMLDPGVAPVRPSYVRSQTDGTS